MFQATSTLPGCPTPLSHLNGSDPVVLLRHYLNFYTQINVLSLALYTCEVHPRDYYPLGTEAFSMAHETRSKAFSLLDELSAYASDHIASLAKQTPLVEGVLTKQQERVLAHILYERGVTCPAHLS
jgi:hypothetical protein